jgi:hypothetical protein
VRNDAAHLEVFTGFQVSLLFFVVDNQKKGEYFMAEPNNLPNNPPNPAGNQGSEGQEGKPPEPNTQGKSTGVTFSPEQQAYLNALLADAKREGKTSAEREAEDAKKKAQGEFETLYNTEKTRADSLQTQLDALQGKYDKLFSAFNKRIEDELAALPDAVREKVLKLKPSDDDPEKLTEFVQTAKELAASTPGQPPTRLPNDPQPKGPPDKAKQEAATDTKRSLINTGRYGGF